MTDAASSYLEHLPAVFQDDPFVGKLLLAFERVLSGFSGDDPANLPSAAPGLERILGQIHTFFDPELAPPEFLPWLASWVATSLREDWDTATRRSFIANVVPLYQRRGTKRALEQLLQLYLNPDRNPQRTIDEAIAVNDADATFPPRYFRVQFTIVDRNPQLLSQSAGIATAIIDREKPAHTFYGLRINYASLQIADPPVYDAHQHPKNGVFVGQNTVLGGVPVPP
jgi:phage tail-like protein